MVRHPAPFLPALIVALIGALPAQPPATARPSPAIAPAVPLRPATGQVIPVEQPEVVPGAPTLQDPAAPQDPEKAKQKAEAERKAAAAKLQQAFQKAVFDRRPSAILAAWAAPEPMPIEEDPELAMPDPLPEAPKPPTPPEGEPPTDPKELEAFQAAQKTAAEAFQKEQQEFQKKKAEFQKKKAAAEQKRQTRLFEILGRDVTLGRWDRLPAFFSGFEEKVAKATYEQLLAKLVALPKQQNNQLQQFAEKNEYSLDDMLALVAIAPGGFDKKYVKLFPALLNLCFVQGHGFEDWVALLREETARPEGERRLDRRMAARFLAAQGRDIEMGAFLPELEKALEDKDREGLNLLARHHVAEHAKERKPELLELAWRATLAALAAGDIDKDQKTDALRRAVSLAPKVRDELGDSWLVESFTTRPERGMEVIATVGAQASQALVSRAHDPKYRHEGLQLLKTAVDALLEQAPERAEEWRGSLNLLADVWLREAQHSYRYSQAESMGPVARRDSFGNIYWVNYGRGYRSTPVRPIEPEQMLELRPDGKWRDMLEDSLRPKYDTTVAELYLKMNEETLAFPYIEALAKTNKDKANELAREFLNVWIRNNDPNSSRFQSNIYNFSYGFNQRASGIPLTRSKQERNLRDLAKWVRKLRAVPNIELDTELLVRAFTASHSAAEVYRIETMEGVFGTLEDLDAKVLARMVQTMRGNLASTWRQPAVQQRAGTKRRQKDIEAEVLKGYTLAELVLGRALAAHEGNWQLMVARAAMLHDLNNFEQDVQKTSEFSGKRRDALAMFAAAAKVYTDAIPDLRIEEESVEAFEFWFNATLGASDIPAIDQDTILARHQIPDIKKALDAIPGDAGERHRARFANSLFTRLSAVNPATKNRYLETGFEIAGDHPQARAARRVYDYYKDLVREIKVVAEVEGGTDVSTEPFGLRVDIHYTTYVERESGGFGKYLQNQANNVNLYYNYGRPPENYRDKFEESIRAALSESFEVQSVTFNDESVSSKATDEFGWRRTPYAYVLLRAKGPEVDRIPPLKMDLDFMDVTGYVVLPVTSAVVPVDASGEPAERPFEKLQVTQILDERKAADGVLGLEIKAQATGLVPELEACLDLAPSDFVVDDIEDQGVSVSRFGDDKDSIVSERLWVARLKAKPEVAEPEKFRFAAPKDEATEVLYQRYDDADLVTATLDVELLGKYHADEGFPWWWVAGPLVLLLGFLGWRSMRKGPTAAEAVGLHLPERITPFTVLGMLRALHDAPNLAEPQRAELDQTIARIERFYFGTSEGDAPDLNRIAEDWLRRA